MGRRNIIPPYPSDSEIISEDEDWDADVPVRVLVKPSPITTLLNYCKKVISYLCSLVYLLLMGSIIMEKWCLSGKSTTTADSVVPPDDDLEEEEVAEMNGRSYYSNKRWEKAESNGSLYSNSSATLSQRNRNTRSSSHISSRSSTSTTSLRKLRSSTNQRNNNHNQHSSLVFFTTFPNDRSINSAGTSRIGGVDDGSEKTWVLDQFPSTRSVRLEERTWYERWFQYFKNIVRINSRTSREASGTNGRETRWMTGHHLSKNEVENETSWFDSWTSNLAHAAWYLLRLLGLLLVILALYWLWTHGDTAMSCAKSVSEGVSSGVGGALASLSSVLRYFSNFRFSRTSLNPADQTHKAAQPVLPPIPPSSVMVERVVSLDELNALKSESEETLKLTRESIDALKIKVAALEEALNKHETRLNVHDDSMKSLESEISKIFAAMKAASTKEKTIEQIISEVLDVRVGETTDGTPVTLKSMFSILKENDDLKRISLEIEAKLKTLNADIGKIQSSSEDVNGHLEELKLDLNVVNDRMTRMELENENRNANVKIEMDVDKIKEAVLPVLTREIEAHVAVSCQSRNCPEGSLYHGLSAEDIELMIKRAISKYDADKTGLPDLALESAGGSILSTRCTKSSELRNSVISYWGFRLWSPPNTPRTIIQPGVVPGECWAFEGSVGDVVIKLAVPAVVTAFTLEHIPKTISRYGNIDSAPKHFQVLGLMSEHDTEDVHDYGTFTYEDNDEPLQYFPVKNATAKPYPIVELKVLSNHGNMKHTCIYRFRVHGAIDLSRSQGYSKNKPVDEAVTRRK